jgi:TetR/AcrR family transcriptional regulator, repressor for uid operon
MRTVDPVKHEEKRSEILEAASRCFAKSGFHGATIAQICAAARISPGHLYHYFSNKEAIVAAITGSGLAYTKERFAAIGEGTDAVDAVLSELDRLRDHQSAKGVGVLLEVLAEASRNPTIAKSLREHSRGMRELLAEFLRAGQARQEVDPSLDVETVASVLISLIDGYKALSVRDPKHDPKKTAKAFETMITRFLSPQGRGPKPLPRPRAVPRS